MIIKFLFFSILFILCITSFSRGSSYIANVKENARSRAYIILTCAYSVWGILVIVSSSLELEWNVLKQLIFYVSEFARIISFAMMIEVFAYLTDFDKEKPKKMYFVSDTVLYIGCFLMLVNLIATKGLLTEDAFGLHFYTESSVLVLVHVILDIAILFGMFLFVIRYYEKCKKPREIYAFKLYLLSISCIFLGFVIENTIIIVNKTYFPAVIIASGILVILFQIDLKYHRSIQYFADDYSDVLAPTYEGSVVITNDVGIILYTNKRAQVFAEGYRDTFEGRDICGLFSLEQSDRDRLYNKGNTNVVFKCNYKKNDTPVTLTCENALDRYKNVFASIIRIKSAVGEAEPDEANKVNTISDSSGEVYKVSNEDARRLRYNELLNSIERGIALFNEGKEELFFMNLKGIGMLAKATGYPALQELTNRIQEEAKISEFSSLSSMIIELDRQYESIKMLYEGNLH